MSEGTSRRLFVAIFPPAPALEHLGRAVDDLAISHADGAAERLTARDGWHVTVAFLGPVPADRLDDATAALHRVASWRDDVGRGDVSRSDVGRGDVGRGDVGRGDVGRGDVGSADLDEGPRLRIAGSGTFGGAGRQILWVGLDGDVAALRRLAEVTGREFTQVGLPAEGRDFQPHLTISRPGVGITPELVASDARQLRTYSGPPWTAESLDLVASDTVPTDAGSRSRYTILASAPLS